jgi:LysM repeat protein
MTFWVHPLRCAVLLVCTLALTGCWPGGYSHLDEEKEPHFLAGKSRVNGMDYPGAIESFEKALEVNPRSGAAHFELGLLYEKTKPDYAAAIHHFERFLQLRPQSDYAEVVKQRILACKQELAKTVSLGPVTQSLQSEFEKLAEENRRLNEENRRTREELDQLRTLLSRRAGSAASASPSLAANVHSPAPSSSSGPTSALLASGATSAASASRSVVRTHTIKAGDTPLGIARKYGVKLEVLMAANPRADARRLQVGQTLNVPPP